MKRLRLLALIILGVAWIHPRAFPQDSAAGAEAHSVQSAPPTTAYTLPPDKLRKAEALYMLRARLQIIDSAWSVVVLLGLLFFGISIRYRDWAEAISPRPFVQALIAVPLLLFTIDLFDLPFSLYGHHVSLRYGLSVQGWGSWFADLAKGEAIFLVLGILLLWILVAVIRKSPKRWWLYFWLAAVPISLFLAFIAPVAIDPLFNKFEPLEAKQPELVDAIEKVTRRGGLEIPRNRMYEMKASEKVTTLNAYVTGFGASKRVVVWDTTIAKLTTPETLFVFGHEMGHYVLHHVVYGLIFGDLGLLLGLYLLYLASGWALARSRQRWRLRELGDWAALPLLFLLFGVLTFLGEPVANTLSRHIEHEADVYGLEVTHGVNADSRQVAAHSFQVLGELSLDYPYPNRWVVLWFYNHPLITDRVRFALDYDPWDKGESPQYVKDR